MRAGVGEPDEHAVLLEQPLDRVVVVVREHAAEPRLEVLRDREIEHDVERLHAALGRDRATGFPISSGYFALSLTAGGPTSA